MTRLPTPWRKKKMHPLLHVLPADVVGLINDFATNKIWSIKTANGHIHYEPRPVPYRDIASLYNVRIRKKPRFF